MMLLKALLCAVFVGVAALINTDTDDNTDVRLYINKLFTTYNSEPCFWNPEMVGIITYYDTSCTYPYIMYSYYVGPSDQMYYLSGELSPYEQNGWWEEGPSYVVEHTCPLDSYLFQDSDWWYNVDDGRDTTTIVYYRVSSADENGLFFTTEGTPLPIPTSPHWENVIDFADFVDVGICQVDPYFCSRSDANQDVWATNQCHVTDIDDNVQAVKVLLPGEQYFDANLNAIQVYNNEWPEETEQYGFSPNACSRGCLARGVMCDCDMKHYDPATMMAWMYYPRILSEYRDEVSIGDYSNACDDLNPLTHSQFGWTTASPNSQSCFNTMLKGDTKYQTHFYNALTFDHLLSFEVRSCVPGGLVHLDFFPYDHDCVGEHIKLLFQEGECINLPFRESTFRFWCAGGNGPASIPKHAQCELGLYEEDAIASSTTAPSGEESNSDSGDEASSSFEGRNSVEYSHIVTILSGIILRPRVSTVLTTLLVAIVYGVDARFLPPWDASNKCGYDPEADILEFNWNDCVCGSSDPEPWDVKVLKMNVCWPTGESSSLMITECSDSYGIYADVYSTPDCTGSPSSAGVAFSSFDDDSMSFSNLWSQESYPYDDGAKCGSAVHLFGDISSCGIWNEMWSYDSDGVASSTGDDWTWSACRDFTDPETTSKDNFWWQAGSVSAYCPRALNTNPELSAYVPTPVVSKIAPDTITWPGFTMGTMPIAARYHACRGEALNLVEEPVEVVHDQYLSYGEVNFIDPRVIRTNTCTNYDSSKHASITYYYPNYNYWDQDVGNGCLHENVKAFYFFEPGAAVNFGGSESRESLIMHCDSKQPEKVEFSHYSWSVDAGASFLTTTFWNPNYYIKDHTVRPNTCHAMGWDYGSAHASVTCPGVEAAYCSGVELTPNDMYSGWYIWTEGVEPWEDSPTVDKSAEGPVWRFTTGEEQGWSMDNAASKLGDFEFNYNPSYLVDSIEDS